MGTSGSFLFNPTLAQFADEAFERAGVDPKDIDADHIMSFRRSVGFVFSRWSNRGFRQWKFEQVEHTTSVNENVFDLPVGTIDVQTAVLRRDDVDTEMYPISRSDYLIIADKTLQGRPDRYFVDKRRDTPNDDNPPQLFYWLSGENTTDQIIVNVYKQIEDPGTTGAGTLDIPFRFHEAIASDLAARMAQKYKPENYSALRTEAEQMFREADAEDTESAPMTISVHYGRTRGRR